MWMGRARILPLGGELGSIRVVGTTGTGTVTATGRPLADSYSFSSCSCAAGDESGLRAFCDAGPVDSVRPGPGAKGSIGMSKTIELTVEVGTDRDHHHHRPAAEHIRTYTRTRHGTISANEAERGDGAAAAAAATSAEPCVKPRAPTDNFLQH